MDIDATVYEVQFDPEITEWLEEHIKLQRAADFAGLKLGTLYSWKADKPQVYQAVLFWYARFFDHDLYIETLKKRREKLLGGE